MLRSTSKYVRRRRTLFLCTTNYFEVRYKKESAASALHTYNMPANAHRTTCILPKNDPPSTQHATYMRTVVLSYYTQGGGGGASTASRIFYRLLYRPYILPRTVLVCVPNRLLSRFCFFIIFTQIYHARRMRYCCCTDQSPCDINFLSATLCKDTYTRRCCAAIVGKLRKNVKRKNTLLADNGAGKKWILRGFYLASRVRIDHRIRGGQLGGTCCVRSYVQYRRWLQRRHV